MLKRGGVITGIGKAIDSMLKDSEIDNAIRPHRAVVLWPEVVGDLLAQVSEAEVVRSGVLFVRARSTTWANELTFYKADLIAKLNRRLGGRVIEDIYFKAGGRRPARRDRPEARSAQVTAGPTEAELAAVQLGPGAVPALPETVDERLRRAVERAARTQAWKRAQGWLACARCGALYPPDSPSIYCPLCSLGKGGAP